MTLKLGKVNHGPHLPTLVVGSLVRDIAQGQLKAREQLPDKLKSYGVTKCARARAFKTWALETCAEHRMTAACYLQSVAA